MSRLKRAADILNAAENWKRRCVIEEGSVFGSLSLWIVSNFKQLEEKNVNLTVLGSGSEEDNSLDRMIRLQRVSRSTFHSRSIDQKRQRNQSF